MQNRQLLVTMPDGSKWIIPLIAIINYRMVKVSEISKRPLKETGNETVRLFAAKPEAIIYWANEMDWADLAPYARQIESPQHLYESAWPAAPKEIIVSPGNSITALFEREEIC